jgi:hypothetical protein
MFAPAYPGFPVERFGGDEAHAAFLNESRTRGSWWRPVQEIRAMGRNDGAEPLSNAFTPSPRSQPAHREMGEAFIVAL